MRVERGVLQFDSIKRKCRLSVSSWVYSPLGSFASFAEKEWIEKERYVGAKLAKDRKARKEVHRARRLQGGFLGGSPTGVYWKKDLRLSREMTTLDLNFGASGGKLASRLLILNLSVVRLP